MGELLMRRRGMVVTEGGGEPKPYPYSISDWENASAQQIKASVKEWNRFEVECTGTYTAAGMSYNALNGQNNGGNNPVSSPLYMTFPSGSTVNIQFNNISNPNNMPIEIKTVVANSTTQISALNVARFTNSTNKSVTATMSSDTGIGGIWFIVVRTGRYVGNKFSCDIEVYVNGERWI